MSLNQSRYLLAVAALAVLGLSACASEAPVAQPAPSASSTSPTATPTPTAEPDPLLVISGTVADQEGQSLTVTLTTTSVRPPSEQDWADYAASCAASDPAVTPSNGPDARVVTFAVASVASPGFTGWTDARGVGVSGDLYTGPIWGPGAQPSGTDCSSGSSIATRAGSGEVRVFTSSDYWNLPTATPVGGDGSITLELYGISAVTSDGLGGLTGLTEVANCETTASPEFDALAAQVVDFTWGKAQVTPEQCFYGRTPIGY